MKKIFSLMLAMILTVFCLTVTASAENENFLKGEWIKDDCKNISVEKDSDGNEYVLAGPILRAWNSPKINVLDAVIEALGDEDYVDVIFTFEVKAKSGSDITALGVIRGVETKGHTDWNEDYEAYCEENDCDDLLMKKGTDGNIFMNLKSNSAIKFSADEWYYFESKPVTVYKANVSKDFFSAWNLGLHEIKGMADTDFLEFRNAGVYLADEYESPEEEIEETPTPKPQTTPTPKPTATPTPEATGAPEATAEASNDDNVSTKQGGSHSALIGVTIAVSAIALAAIGVTAVLIVKDKKKK